MKNAGAAVEGLKGKLVLIAGSAAADAVPEKLEMAHQFVRLLTRSILETGGGLVLFVSGEPTNADGVPLVFDWTALRELDAASPAPADTPRVVVVTSGKARTTKMAEEHRALLAKLSASGVADVVSVPNDVHTGGNIGDEQTSRAAAMIALGGGKGVQDRSWKVRKLGRPVLPFDIVLGSFSNDGAGAVGLHRALMDDPTQFFPMTGAAVRARLLGMSLETPALALHDLAARAISAITTELDAAQMSGPLDVLILTALPQELEAARTVLGAPEGARQSSSNTIHWRMRVPGPDTAERLVGVASFGSAGNVDAAVTTAELIADLHPRLVVMIGIAAGMREKCSLGDVVIAERIVAHEGAALATGPDGRLTLPRPESYRSPYAVLQDVTAYLSDTRTVRARLTAAYDQLGLKLPPSSESGPVTSDVLPRQVTVASGEKLLRDPSKFRALRDLHGRIEVVEMEAAGIAAACSHAGVPYIVIRGISDFGDEKKDDQFHRIAAMGAAVVAVDLIRNALRAPK